MRLPIVETGLLNNLELYIWRCLWEVLFDLKYVNIHSWIILSACSSLNLIHRSDRPVFSNSCHLFITQGSSVRLSAPWLACGKHFTFGSIESISGNQANWQYSNITFASCLSLLKTDTKMCLFSLTLCYDPSIAGHWWSGRRMVSWRQLVADASHSLGRRDSQGYKYINTHRLIPAAVEALTVCVSPPGPAKAVAMRRPLSSLPMPSGSNFQICFIFAISSFSPTADFFQQSSVSKREFTKKTSLLCSYDFFKNCWHS